MLKYKMIAILRYLSVQIDAHFGQDDMPRYSRYILVLFPYYASLAFPDPAPKFK